MKKYKYGVGTQVWILQAENDMIAEITMSIHMKRNIPIAIYEPYKKGISPLKILEKYSKEDYDTKLLQKAYDSIERFS